MGTLIRDDFVLLTDSVSFTPSGGQFGGGEAPEPYRAFFGIGDPTPVGGPFSLGGAVSARLPFLGNVELFRARVFGELAAVFGLEIMAAFDPGSIDAVLPYDLAVAFPELDPVGDEGEIIAIHFAGTEAFDAESGFTTSFPSLRFQLDLVAALDVLLAAELGVGGSNRTYVLADFSPSTRIPLISIDTARQADDGAADPVNLLGVTTEELLGMTGLDPAYDANGAFAGISVPLNTFVSKPEAKEKPKAEVEKEGDKVPEEEEEEPDLTGIDLGSIAILVPSINTASKYVAGVFVTDPTRKLLNGEIVPDLDENGVNIGEGNKDDLVVLTLDVDGLITFATGGGFPPLEFGLPPLEGSLGPMNFEASFYYNLLDVELEAALPLVQEFTLTPELRTRLRFFELENGAKGAEKFVHVVQVERQLVYDPTGVFQDANVEERLRELAQNPTFGRDIELFVDFEDGIPGSFTGETGSIGGRMVWRQAGATEWQNLDTDTVLARSAPTLGQDQTVELDLSGIEVGYRISRGSGSGAEIEIIPVAFDPTDSLYRQQVAEIVAPLQQTPFLPDIGALNLRYDGATTYVEVETQAFPLATNRTGLEFDLSLLLSGLAASAEFNASVDVGPFTLGAGFDIDLGPLFQESFPLLNLEIVDLYNETFRLQDSHVTSFVLGGEPPPTDYGDAIVGTPGADSLEGTEGDDQIVGLGGDDVLRGLGGADTILPGEGNATVEGGAGEDVLDFSDLDARVLLYPYLPGMQPGARFGVTLGGGWAERPDAAKHEDASLIFYDGIERVRLTDAPDFVDLPHYWLTPPPPVIETLGDDDWADVELPNVILRMGEGDDRVTFRPAGLDEGETPIEIDGGPGTDTLIIQDSPNGADPVLVADLGLGTLSDASGTIALVSGFETLRAQVKTPIKLVGDAERNVLDGSNVFLGGGGFNDEPVATGAATLDGQGGNDTLLGSAHNDLLIGGPGADSMSGGAGADTVSYAGAPTSVFIDLDAGGVGRGYRGEAQGDVLVGIEHVLGTAFNDILIGSNGSETLEGGDGDDRLAAQDGFDLLLGGAGNDLLARGLLADSKAANITGFNVFDGGDDFDFVAFSVNDVGLSGSVGGTARYRTVESRFLASDRIGTQDRDVTFSYKVTDARFLSARLGEGGADGTAQIIAPELRSKIILTSIGGSARFDYTHSGFAGFETSWNAGSAPISETYAGFTRAAIVGLDIPLPLGRVGGALGRRETQNEYLDKYNGSDNIIKSSYSGSVLSVNAATALRSADVVASTDILRNIEGIIGTHNNDRIFGNAGDNALFGNGGADYIEGGAGDDRLGFGEGESLTNDFSFPGAPGFGRGGGFLGPTGVQPLLTQLRTLDPDAVVTSASPRVNVGQVKVGSSNSITDFGSFLWGGAGSDTLDLRFDRGIGFYPSTPPTARALVDLDAAPTNTTISTVTGQRVVYGEAKWLTFRDDIIEKATLFGIENVIGSAQNDTILGDARDNVIEGMAGADSMDGRGGIDTLSYALAPTGVTLNFRADAGRLVMDNTQPLQPGAGHAAGDLARNFEVFVGSAHADTMLLDLLLPTIIAEPTIAFDLDVIQLGGNGQVSTWTFDYPARFAQAAVPPATLLGDFDLGDGDDVVTLLGIAQGTIDLGAGNDMLSIAGMGLTILLGVGDDMVTVLDTPAGSYEFLSAELRTTTIFGDDGDDLDTVVFEGGGLLQLILTPSGARVLRLGDLAFSPESVTPQEIIDFNGYGAVFSLQQDNTPIELGERSPMREVIELALSAPAIFDLIGIEQVIIGGEVIRLDSVDPVVQADRALTIAEDARDPFALGARPPAAEVAADALYRVVDMPDGALLLRPDDTPLAVGETFAAADLRALKVLPGQNYGVVADTFTFALVGAAPGTPDRIVSLPPEPRVQGVALGITAPYDPLGNPLTITVTEVPTAGTIFFLLPDPAFAGTGLDIMIERAVALGDTLSVEQLAGLHYRAARNEAGDFGGFAYVAETGVGFRELAATPGAETADPGVDLSARDGSAAQRIAITVSAVNDVPDVSTLLYPLSPGGLLDGQLLAEDAEDDDFTFVLVSGPSLGVLSMLPDGSFTYLQDAAVDFAGASFVEDSFIVRAIETGTGLASADAVQILRIVNPAMWARIVFDTSRPEVFFDEDGAPIALGGLGTHDEILGHAGPDQLFGFGGDDLLHGLAGHDSLDGGSGDDRLIGGEGDDTLLGDVGADLLLGGDGADSLDGGGGLDTIAGGTGNDAYAVDDAADRVLETRTGGADTVHASVTWALGPHLEDLVLIGDAAIDGTGNGLSNVITGNDAANRLAGAGGADTLIGGGGDDLYLADAIDILIEQAGGGHDTVVVAATFALPDHIEVLRFSGTANARGEGNGADNFMQGNVGNNRIFGHAGDDTLVGGAGDDTLHGGDGADSLVGGEGVDRLDGGPGADTYVVIDADILIELPGAGIDTVLSAIDMILPVNFEHLTLLGQGGLSATGNAADNVLTGNGGANMLRGLAGDDSIAGGQGADTLDGGLGADTLSGGGAPDRFLWSSTAEGGDVVTDFRPGEDLLAFASAGFGGLAIGVLDAALFANNAPNAATGQFVYTRASGTLAWDEDGTGAAAAVTLAWLTNTPLLSAADIVIVA